MTISPSPPKKTLVFIDSGVSNYQSLVDGLGDDTPWVLLDADQDGVLQMQAALADYSAVDGNKLDSIQVISHGSVGTLVLGTAVVNQDNLGRYASAWQDIGRALTDTGDILLYGCNVGQGGAGQAFINALTVATGADVAASTDATGAAAMGGNWILEQTAGPIETAVLHDEEGLVFLGGTTSLNFDVQTSVVVNGVPLQFSTASETSTWVYGINSFRVGITPPESLAELRKYAYSSTSKTIEEGEYVAVSNGQGAFALVQIVDSQSRSHGGSIDGVVFTSSTIVVSEPIVSLFSPSDDLVGVLVNSNITLVFNEEIQRGTGNIVLKTSTGEIVATYDAATSKRSPRSLSVIRLPSSEALSMQDLRKNFR